eukprot:TRINITY_DN7670_c0_g1_i4.p1 TRINITY_DN7670_c0_g1~~TRINITY_DN7670_c0_g1_i4.p1  ORF type:complete len:981 (+),score=371.34 TRINITY_DN7670_c0_g1_i4:189-3131(+)
MEGFGDFQRAVGVAHAPTSAIALRQEAESYLASLKAHPQIWEFCVATLAKPKGDPVETFWCFGTLLDMLNGEHYQTFDDASKAAFEKVLVDWANNVCPSLDPTQQSFVKNKFAQVLVTAFMLSGYPKRWGNFFHELYGLLPKGPQMILLWLRILESIDVIIVEPLRAIRDQAAHARNTLIKDSIRQQCFPQISNTWFHIMSEYHQTRPDIACQCMQVISPYFAWIDIALVSTEDWTNMLYYFVSHPELREDAIKCLTELCSKKVEDKGAKLQLLCALKVGEFLPKVVIAVLNEHGQLLANSTDEFLVDTDGGGFVSSVADLCLRVGQELIDIVAGLYTTGGPVLDTAKAMMGSVIPMLLDLTACGHPGISKKACEYSIRRYIDILKRHPDLPRTYLPRLLTIVGDRIAINAHLYNADPAAAGDYEALVEALRKQLYVVFKNVCSLERDLGIEFTVSRVHAALASLAAGTLQWPQAEAALRLLHVFGEELFRVYGSSKAMLMKQSDTPLHKLLTDVFQSGVGVKLQHHLLGITFLEVLERYSAYFVHTPNARPLLLELTLGQGGAGHPHPLVRHKACATFCSLVKPLKNELLSCVDEVTRQAQRLLASNTLEMTSRCHLFESIGVLIAKTDGQVCCHEYLKIMAQPLFETLRGAVQSPSEGHAQHVTNSVDYLASLSKGFSGLLSPTMGRLQGDVATTWKEACELLVKVSELYSHLLPVREKVLMFVHRMIDLLGSGVRPYMIPFMRDMLRHTELGDLPKVVRVPTQLLQRLKNEVVDDVDEYFAPLIQRIFATTDTVWLEKITSLRTEQGREHIELLKAYVAMLVQASELECVRIFLTQRSNAILNTVLDSLQKGCVSPPEMEIAPYCYKVLLRMAQSWYTTVPGFSDFLASQIIPMTAYTVSRPDYNPHDMKSSNVAEQIAQMCLFLCTSAGPEAFMACFSSAWRLSPEQQQPAMQAFASGKSKEVKALIRGLVASGKR